MADDEDVASILATARRDETPPADVEARTRAALRASGLLGGRPRRVRSPWVVAAGLAASLVVGVWYGRTHAPREVPTEPEFLLMLYEDAAFRAAHQPGDQKMEAEYTAWARGLHGSAHALVGERLIDGGTEFRPNEPGAPLGGGLANPDGFFIIEARDEQAALEVAKSCPHLRYGGRVVVRPIAPPR